MEVKPTKNKTNEKTYRKKIKQIGTSNGVLTPKWWMNKNRLNRGDTITMIVNDDYILIKDCKDPFLNDLTKPEAFLLKQLSAQRQEKIQQVRKLAKHAMKALDEEKDMVPMGDLALHEKLKKLPKKEKKV